MKWIDTNNRYIAFFDIMGFKNLVSQNTHTQILKQLEDLTNLIQNLDNSEFGPKDKPSTIKTVIFSDSIILITNRDTIKDGIHLMQVSSFIMDKCFQIGIPIKGCLSHGKFTADFDKSLFFGQPLIDAYLLEEQLYLYSVILSHSFEAKLKTKKYARRILSNNIRWFRYKTPLKGGKSWHYHINWIFYAASGEDRNKRLEKYKSIEENTENFYNTVSGTIRQYVDNTEDFVTALIAYDNR